MIICAVKITERHGIRAMTDARAAVHSDEVLPVEKGQGICV